jgi:hypothetical protein
MVVVVPPERHPVLSGIRQSAYYPGNLDLKACAIPSAFWPVFPVVVDFHALVLGGKTTLSFHRIKEVRSSLAVPWSKKVSIGYHILSQVLICSTIYPTTIYHIFI